MDWRWRWWLGCMLFLGCIGRTEADEVVDDLGESFALEQPPMRIVSLAPSNTEMLYALGLGARVVGVTEFCNFPQAADSVVKVAGFNTVNLERVTQVRPDLIMAIRGNDMESLRSLRELGFPVFSLDIQSLSGMGDALRRMGKLLGVRTRADALADSLDLRVKRVRSRATSRSERPKVLWGFWGEPIYTAGAGTMIDDVFRTAGGQNIGARAEGAWPQVSLETIVLWEPDVLITTHVPGGSENLPNELMRLQQMDGWKMVPAVRDGRVFYVEGDWLLRPGPRLVDALEAIATYLDGEGDFEK